MYTNNNMRNFNDNMYVNNNLYPDFNKFNNDDRFGLLGPLLVGGLAGYAIGNNNYTRPCCGPVYYQPMPYQTPVSQYQSTPYQSYNFYYK